MSSISDETAPIRHLWGDADQDGLKDLFMLSSEGNLFFHNLGSKGFEDITAKAFPNGAGCGVSGFWGDFNGDDQEDLFLFHSEGFTLFENEGGLYFRDVTEELGLDPKLPAGSVRLDDFDADGDGDLLVQTRECDRIYENREGREFVEVVLALPNHRLRALHVGETHGVNRLIPDDSLLVEPVDPITGSAGISPEHVFDDHYINDNSPGSVGVGIPEIEGGDDLLVPNDIVDGSICASDIMEGSITPEKVSGTAATLDGDQNFDEGTFVIDSVSDRIGVGTETPTATLNVVTEDAESGLKAENHTTSGETYGVHGISDSTEGRGVYGHATATMRSSRTEEAYGVLGRSDMPGGSGVRGTCNLGFGVHGEGFVGVRGTGPVGVQGDSVGGVGVSGSGDYGVRGTGIEGVRGDSTDGIGVRGESTTGTGIHGSGSEGVRGESTNGGVGVRGESVTGTGILGSGNEGVRGDSTDGTGVRGESTMGTGIHGSGSEGVRGESTTGGIGVRGIGFEGISGEGDGNSGVGVRGTGFEGIKGISVAPNGRGIHGYASQGGPGVSYGIYGESASDDGRGVYGTSKKCGVHGHATDAGGTSIDSYGVYGLNDSDNGMGVFGYADSGEGITYGVMGQSQSSEGRGVYGFASSENGANAYGVYGRAVSVGGWGVFGIAPENAIQGYCTSREGIAVHGVNGEGNTSGSLGGEDFGVKSTGDLVVTGAFRGNLGANEGAPYPRPAYVSEWLTINQGQTLSIDHNLHQGSADDYVVDLQFKSSGKIHQIYYGANSRQTVAGSVWEGAYWFDLDQSSIKVKREVDDVDVQEVRVRIWIYN